MTPFLCPQQNPRRTSMRVVAAAVSVMVVAAGCGSSDSPDGTAAGAEEDRIKVGVILVGPKNDESFNEAAYIGATETAEAYPELEITATLESRVGSAAQIDAVHTLAPINDVVIGNGSEFGAIFEQEASNFPETTFLTIGGYPKTYQENVYSIAYDRVAAYVTGAIAAELTESDVIGFVGGADIPPVNQSMAGFVAAINRADPSIEVLTNVIGSFDDVAKAKSATAAMLSEGADVINAYLNAGAPGAYQAAKEVDEGIGIFKVDLHECAAYPNIIGTNIGDNTASTRTLLGSLVEGTLEPKGVTIFAGLQDPGIQRIELCPKYAEDKAIAALKEDTVAGINDGSIEMPEGVLNPRPSGPYREGFDGEVKNVQ
jgi:basic membrane protein A